MTVAELIAELQKMPPGLSVVTDLHSEYKTVKAPQRVAMVAKGGWWSKPYGDWEKALAQDVCYIEAV